MRPWEPGIAWTKDPRTRDEYIITLENFLREGDLISTFVISGTVAVGQIGLVKISEAITENKKNIVLWAEGGVDGESYPVAFEFNTVKGYRDRYTVIFQVATQ
jgi:hypothetical protein